MLNYNFATCDAARHLHEAIRISREPISTRLEQVLNLISTAAGIMHYLGMRYSRPDWEDISRAVFDLHGSIDAARLDLSRTHGNEAAWSAARERIAAIKNNIDKTTHEPPRPGRPVDVITK